MDLTTPLGIDAYLQTTQFHQYRGAQRLAEGFSSFVYRVHLRASDDAQESTPRSLIIKHVEGYAARATTWKLDQSRLEIESKALQLLSQPEYQIAGIRPPKVYHFDEESWVLILADAGNVPSLKGWMKPGTVSLEDFRDIGARIGKFLATVHNNTSGNAPILQLFSNNDTGKYLSSTLYFKNLPQAAEKFGYNDQYFQQAARQGQEDILGGSEVLTLGDFWTGNVLVSENLELFLVDLELAKAGTADFDIGQMAAEMYCIAAFRDHELGMALLDSFLESYRDSRGREVDVGKVAIRIGSHLIIIAPNAWRGEASEAQIKEQVGVGAELIRLGIRQEEQALKTSIVKKLYS